MATKQIKIADATYQQIKNRAIELGIKVIGVTMVALKSQIKFKQDGVDTIEVEAGQEPEIKVEAGKKQAAPKKEKQTNKVEPVPTTAYIMPDEDLTPEEESEMKKKTKKAPAKKTAAKKAPAKKAAAKKEKAPAVKKEKKAKVKKVVEKAPVKQLEDYSQAIQKIVAQDGTKADKIRALAKKELSRSEIAFLLGIKYQFVRNVLTYEFKSVSEE